jgi:rhamnose utilization protein RhaD (predicted bifunctional aldolase and dehydrogenase)
VSGGREFAALRAVSAELGSDPLLVQAAGGNTSIKSDGIMWIKASGTWLRDTGEKEIFVPLDLRTLTEALRDNSPDCESCTAFVRQDLNPSGLRPSIETSVHGLMAQKVVLHVHCVNTIAWMILKDAREKVAPLLAGLDWAFVPYARPGLQLSRAIRAAIRPETNVLLLQNHGLAVAGETVEEAASLLREVVGRLRRKVQSLRPANLSALQQSAPEGFYAPASVNAHGFSLLPWAAPLACNNVYYPDHAVFLGTQMPNSPVPGSPVVVLPGQGVFVRDNAKPAVEPMLGCLTDVFSRLSPSDELKALTSEEIALLLDWDAEKYRQSLSPSA